MKDTGKWMIRWTLVMSALVLVIPFQGIHHLFEHHDDEVHVCDFETCVRKEIIDCNLCEFVNTNNKFTYDSERIKLNEQLQEIVQPPCCNSGTQNREIQKNRGPPHRNDSSTTLKS